MWASLKPLVDLLHAKLLRLKHVLGSERFFNFTALDIIAAHTQLVFKA